MKTQTRRGRHAFFLVLLTCALAACGVKPQDAGPGPSNRAILPVTTAKLASGSIRSVLSYNANLAPRYTVDVVAKSAGRITSLPLDLGSAVKRGDVIAQVEHTQLDAQLEQARANLQAAEAKLTGVQAQGRPEQIAEAQATLDAAVAKLDGMRAGRPEQVTQAKADLDAAQAKVSALQQGRPEQVAQAQAAVTQAQAQLDSATAALQQLQNGPTAAQVRQAQLAVEQARDRLYADQTAFDAQVGSGAITKEQRQSGLDVDQTAIDQATAALNVLTDKPTPEALNRARAAVSQAQGALDAARKQADIALHPGSQQDLTQAQAGVTAKQQQLALAQKPYSPADLAQAQSAVNGAQAGVALAARPYTDNDEAQAAAGVAQAQAAVDLVQSQIDDSTIKAPVDGLVSRKLVAEGDQAAVGSPLVTIAATQWEIVVQVSEQAIGQIHEGQQVQMTASAFPDKPFAGSITAIAPVIDAQTRTFTVKITPSGDIPSLRGGMSTRVDVPTVEHANAVLAPRSAIVNKDGQAEMFTVQDGKARALPVTTGLADDTSIEILKGATVGDAVVVTGQERLNDQDPVTIQAG